MSSKIMTLSEVSQRTGIAVNTFRYYRATGERGPKTFRLGGHVVALEEDVEDWISACHDAEQLSAESGPAVART